MNARHREPTPATDQERPDSGPDDPRRQGEGDAEVAATKPAPRQRSPPAPSAELQHNVAVAGWAPDLPPSNDGGLPHDPMRHVESDPRRLARRGCISCRGMNGDNEHRAAENAASKEDQPRGRARGGLAFDYRLARVG